MNTYTNKLKELQEKEQRRTDIENQQEEDYEADIKNVDIYNKKVYKRERDYYKHYLNVLYRRWCKTCDIPFGRKSALYFHRNKNKCLAQMDKVIFEKLDMEYKPYTIQQFLTEEKERINNKVYFINEEEAPDINELRNETEGIINYVFDNECPDFKELEETTEGIINYVNDEDYIDLEELKAESEGIINYVFDNEYPDFEELRNSSPEVRYYINDEEDMERNFNEELEKTKQLTRKQLTRKEMYEIFNKKS